ncbi:uncharacterized protein LOC133515594 [Cydia pomonella]|uniref:uncharacterized protein LOC133515594 n=1 Tax=Cydia pomonella TaxID=82600 RepID=UPI002ADDE5CB|nr:uncharacterized protein LOC133515594 [Cydia pomonella]
MLLRRAVTSLIFIRLATVWCHVELESEDYFFPLEATLNYCKLADECHHDRVPVCGQDASGNFRAFRDDCDLYEYCCDEKKQFRHVEIDICAGDPALSR